MEIALNDFSEQWNVTYEEHINLAKINCIFSNQLVCFILYLFFTTQFILNLKSEKSG